MLEWEISLVGVVPGDLCFCRNERFFFRKRDFVYYIV